MDGKWWKVLILLVLGFTSYGQYVYTYTDPCTGVLNSVTITQPSGSVTLFYAGQYNTFTQAQLQAGAFELWVQGINATAPPGSNPCAGSGGTITTGTNAAVGSNTANNVSGIINIAAGLGSSLGGGSISTGGVSTSTSSNTSSGSSSGNGDSGSGDGSSNDGGDDSGDGGDDSGSSGSSSGSGGNKSNGGGSGSNGGSSSGSGTPSGSGGGNSSEGSGTGSSGGTTEGGSTEETGALGSQSITSSSGGQSESGGDSGGDSGGGGGGGKSKSKQEKIGRGALIGAGDVVVIRNSSDIKETGKDNLKINTSITHVNTKQNFIKGVNLNYTTGENVANITLYGSYKNKGFMGVGSNSFMTNFTSDWFNTTTLLTAQQTWKVTWLAGTNYTFGQLGTSNFGNWSVVGGAFTGFNGKSFISGNIMMIGVYSPYIFYYEGQWYSSGILLVPLANVDFKVTDKFKWSISFSGAYEYKASVLNYQLLTGTKMLL